MIVVHGFKGFRDWGFFPHVAETLAGDGHAVVSFDFSLNGVSATGAFDRLEDFARNTFTAELDELHRVIGDVRDGALVPRPVRTIGILGHSRGGAISILAAAEAIGRSAATPAALVTWGAVSHFDRWTPETVREWRATGRQHVLNQRTGQHLPLDVGLLDDFEANRERLDVRSAAARVSIPWLVVHGDADNTVGVEDAHRLVAANPRARLAIVPGAGHTFEATHPFAGTTPALEAALDVTRAHFRRHLTAERVP